jgi:Tol biopolymer transport system component
MVTRSGRVKILDFGLAKPMLSPVDGDDMERPTFDGSATEPGLILGTVGYMSPEQARGESVGTASDQFSFGAILHEMATGTAAFKRETPMQTLLAIANVDRMPFTPGPVAFRLLVERCLAKDPAQRFASTTEIRDRLQRILDGLPKPVEPVDEDLSESSSGSMIAVPAPPPHASRKVAATVLGGLVVFGLGLLAARLIAHSPAPDLAAYHYTPLVSSGSIDAFPALSPGGKTIAYSEPVDGTFQIFTEQSSLRSRTQRTKSGQDCFYPFWSPDGLRIYYVSGQDLWSVSESGGSPELVQHSVLNADISVPTGMLALLRPDNFGASLWLMPPGSQPKRVDGFPPVLAGEVKISPDGSEAGISGTTLDGSPGFWLVSLPRGVVRRYAAARMRGFSFFPDSRNILYGSNHLWRANALRGNAAEITAGSGRENWPALARDGHEAVFSTAAIHYDVAAFGAGTGQATVNLPAPALYSNASPAWSPKRAEFAYVTERSGSPEIHVRDAASGWERKVAGQGDASDLAFSPDGQRIAYTQGDSIWVSSTSAEHPIRLAPGSHPVWSPDGNWLAFCAVDNGQPITKRLHLGASQPPQVVRAQTGETLAWSPDGAWILTLRPNRTLLLVSPDGAKTQQVGNGWWLAATWSHDHSHILALRKAHSLQVVTLNLTGVEEGPVYNLGSLSPALAFAEAIGCPPVSGFSLSPDGTTFLVSLVQVQSDLWKASGF